MDKEQINILIDSIEYPEYNKPISEIRFTNGAIDEIIKQCFPTLLKGQKEYRYKFISDDADNFWKFANDITNHQPNAKIEGETSFINKDDLVEAFFKFQKLPE